MESIRPNILTGAAEMNHHYLDDDVFTMMMMSKSIYSIEWVFGVTAFTLQMFLGSLVGYELIREGGNFLRPFGYDSLLERVEPTSYVRMAQFVTIILAFMTQNDVLNSVRTVVLLRPFTSNPWERIIGEQTGKKSMMLWGERILLPNLFKFLNSLSVSAMASSSFSVVV